MSKTLKLEISVADLGQNGVVVSEFATTDYVANELSKKATLNAEGKVDPSLLPDYTYLDGLVDKLDDVEQSFLNSDAEILNAAKSYSDNKISENNSKKADLVEGKVPFEQLPFSMNFEQNVSTEFGNVRQELRQNSESIVSQMDGLVGSANSYTDGKVLEEREFLNNTINEYKGEVNSQLNNFGNEVDDILKSGASLPYDPDLEYVEGALTLKDGEIQQFVEGVWVPFNKTVDASDVKDESGLSQQEWNNGVESIADLLAITNPKNGSRIFVKSYHSGLNKGGGTFVYNSAKSLINDGVVCFNGWVRDSFMFITSSMAGCVIDGVSDDTQALQRGVDYTAQNNFAFYVDEGVHYLNAASFKRWGSDHNYQTYCPIIELKYSNISVVGKSEKSILKYGDGITYTGWDKIGYVGAQLFSANPSLQLDNFELIGCTIDGNGYNNKIRGVNGGGTSAGSQAVYITKGDNTRIVGNKFKDLSGYQALFIAYDTENTLVESNEFVDTGWLDGTNWTPNYTDQSTIYLGGTYLCRNNKLTQSYDGMFAGTAFELHGIGTAVGNYVEKYASTFLSAAVLHNPRTILLANSAIDCTMFLGTDTQREHNNYVYASGNYFRQRTLKLDENTIYGQYRNMVYFFGAYAPNSCQFVITGNTFDTDRLYVDSTDSYLKQYNSVIAAAHVTAFTFSNNVVSNHKGHFLRLLRQSVGSIYTISNNTFDNCGVDDSVDLGNSIIYFDNDGAQDFGVRPAEMNFANNTFKSCKYGQYFGGAKDVLGDILCPYSLVVDNDVHDKWITTIRVKSGFQVNYDFYNEYNYKVNSTYNAAKDINGYAMGYNTVNQRGEIKFIENGVSKSFKKTNNSLLWTKHNEGLITLSAAYDPASILPNTQIEYIFNDVFGVTLGMSATPTFDKFLSGVQMWAQVTANQQVVVYFRNGTASAVDIPSGTLKVDVI